MEGRSQEIDLWMIQDAANDAKFEVSLDLLCIRALFA